MRRNFTGVSYLDPAGLKGALQQESDYWAKLLKEPRFKAVIQQ